MRMNEGIVRVRRICKNVKLTIRGTARAAGYDLALAQVARLLAHGRVLMKTSL